MPASAARARHCRPVYACREHAVAGAECRYGDGCSSLRRPLHELGIAPPPPQGPATMQSSATASVGVPAGSGPAGAGFSSSFLFFFLCSAAAAAAAGGGDAAGCARRHWRTSPTRSLSTTSRKAEHVAIARARAAQQQSRQWGREGLCRQRHCSLSRLRENGNEGGVGEKGSYESAERCECVRTRIICFVRAREISSSCCQRQSQQHMIGRRLYAPGSPPFCERMSATIRP